MKNSTNITKTFAQIRKELTESVTAMFGGGNPFETDKLKTKAEVLALITGRSSDFVNDKKSIFNSGWLRKHFTVSELASVGIFIEGDIDYKIFEQHATVFMLGNSESRPAYYRNEHVSIVLMEEAKISIDAVGGNSFIKMDAFDSATVKANISSCAMLELYACDNTSVNIELSGHGKLDLMQSGNCKTVVNGSDICSVVMNVSGTSRVEVDFSDLSTFLLKLQCESTAVLNYTKLTNSAMILDGDFTGNYFTGKDCGKLGKR